MDNNFEDKREYSESNNTIEPIVNTSKPKHNRKISVAFIIILIISMIGSSILGSILTLKFTSQGVDEVKTQVIYNGPTEFKQSGEAMSVTEIVKMVGTAVVGVSTQSIVDRGFFGLQQQEGIGSGFIINEEGHILTNYHVIEGAQIVKIIFYDGVETEAKVINYDEANDIALLKIMDSTITVPSTVVLGNSDELQVGESVVAIGSPLGKEFLGTTTAGIISALDRDITIDGKTLKLLQTDTAINPGNSGGPLINSRGEVIGINTAKFGGSTGEASIEGIGFAIPINQAKQKLEELSKPILRIGIKGRVIDENLSKNLNMPQGIYVVEVEEFSNAERAGVRSGDVIVKFDGKDVKTFDDVNEIKSKHSVGDTIKIVVSREGKERTLDMVLNE